MAARIVVAVRVDPELRERLEALAQRIPGSNRTSLARVALERGVESLEAEFSTARGGPRRRRPT